jgi:hypothetical protein
VRHNQLEAQSKLFQMRTLRRVCANTALALTVSARHSVSAALHPNRPRFRQGATLVQPDPGSDRYDTASRPMVRH